MKSETAKTYPKQTCISCTHYVSATGDCARMFYYASNGQRIPDSIEAAVDMDAREENNCEEFRCDLKQ